MNSKTKLPSAKTAISAAASVAATTMLVRSIVRDFLPYELKRHLATKFYSYYATFTKELTITIYEFEGLVKNQLFASAELYLATIVNPSIKRFRASVPEKEMKIHFSVQDDEDLIDKFCGFQVIWRLVRKDTRPRHIPVPDESRTIMTTELQYLELTFHKKHKKQVFYEYLPYILERSKDLKNEKKTLKLHTLKNDGPRFQIQWQAVNLDHSATFETLAMDHLTKKMIVDDLDRFLKRKEFYKKVGKAWKRGYLLFGPPGTGKSSLIAAMANYLNFDVYDLELTDISCNSELRKLLIRTANRSILVVEDIDASLDLSERKATVPNRTNPCYQHHEVPKVTLSGLLNFTDGLWSSCGEERIVIFTTNHREKLDPALLRPGRMDVQIHMSYCTPGGFRMLISNYLGIEDHPLALKAEGMIEETNVTPAEVAEQLLKNDDPDHTLHGLIEFLENKKVSEKERLDRDIFEAPQGEVSPIEHDVPNKEVKNLEEKEDVSEPRKNCKLPNGLQQLIKKNNASPGDVREQVLKIYEAVDALKKLMGIVGGEKGLEYIKYSDSVGQSSGAVIMPKSGENDEKKAE